MIGVADCPSRSLVRYDAFPVSIIGSSSMFFSISGFSTGVFPLLSAYPRALMHGIPWPRRLRGAGVVAPLPGGRNSSVRCRACAVAGLAKSGPTEFASRYYREL